ncbi:MAG: hypothetical protein H6707_05345 [Deltaproteobacteria bacterium]|nr:hypothetical protein [Deltaproteobacteria bacterium]
MLRSISCRWRHISIALLALSWASPARAQVTIEKIEIRDSGGSTITDADLADYFNRARCECAEALTIEIEYKDAGNTGSMQLVSGPGDCLTTEKEIEPDCRVLWSTQLSALEQKSNTQKISVTTADLMLESSDDCTRQRTNEFNLQVMVGDTEFTAATVKRSYTVDTLPPNAPIKNAEPTAGEQLVSVGFSAAKDGESGVKYQILCDPARASAASPYYEAAINLCGTTSAALTSDGGTSDAAPADAGPSDATPTDATSADARTTVDSGTISSGVASLAKAFVCSDPLSQAGTVTISGLVDGQLYNFYVVAIDTHRNASTPVFLGSATPASEEDLWERYKRSGGKATSGCTVGSLTSGGLLLLLIVPLGLWLLRRRPGMLVVLLLLGAQQSASADAGVNDERYASPRRFAFEIKFGPYAPQIDSEFDGDPRFNEQNPPPFRKLFGDGQALMVRGEFDVQLWQGFGSIGIGIVGGYYRNSAKALADNGNATNPSTSSSLSAGETAVTLAPLAVLAVYRFDWLARRFSVPLVPFVKFGINYTLWWIEKGDGSLAEVNDDKASGGSAGIQFNAGLALLLDVFEPSAAKNLDADTGVNHTYLFFEFVHQATDGFGSEKRLDVGDTTWQAGLAFEF